MTPVLMSNNEKLREKLQNHYNQQRVRNPQYSLRAMARKMGVSKTTLTQFLNERRKCTPLLALQICKLLNFTEEETLKVLNDIIVKKKKPKTKP